MIKKLFFDGFSVKLHQKRCHCFISGKNLVMCNYCKGQSKKFSSEHEKQ